MSDDDTIKVIRVLTYVGPRAWVERTLARGFVQGKVELHNGARIEEVRGAPRVIADFEEVGDVIDPAWCRVAA